MTNQDGFLLTLVCFLMPSVRRLRQELRQTAAERDRLRHELREVQDSQEEALVQAQAEQESLRGQWEAVRLQAEAEAQALREQMETVKRKAGAAVETLREQIAHIRRALVADAPFAVLTATSVAYASSREWIILVLDRRADRRNVRLVTIVRPADEPAVAFLERLAACESAVDIEHLQDVRTALGCYAKGQSERQDEPLCVALQSA